MSTSDYESKFSDFIQMCGEAKDAGFDEVIVSHPWVLGDNYAEIIESLSRLADAKLKLIITARLTPI